MQINKLHFNLSVLVYIVNPKSKYSQAEYAISAASIAFSSSNC